VRWARDAAMLALKEGHMLQERRARRARRARGTGLIVALLLLAVGSYYFLSQTLGVALPEPGWDRIWPVIVILLGLLALWNAYAPEREDRSGQSGGVNAAQSMPK
jgi:hypothetical protein